MIKFLAMEEAIERIGGDKEIYIELLKTFADTYGNDDSELGIIRNSVSANILNDTQLREKTAKAFHKIKGASLTIGANILGASAETLEHSLKDSEFNCKQENIENYKTFVNKFLANYTDTMKEIFSVLGID